MRLRNWQAVGLALLVTILWSSSYVLVKIGLRETAPMGFAALRYLMASAFLILVLVVRKPRAIRLDKRGLFLLVLAAFSGYTVAQGLNFVGLSFLPAVSVSLLLNFTPVLVAIIGSIMLSEIPNLAQVVGALVALIGGFVYFFGYPAPSYPLGIAIVLVSGVGWALYLVLTRKHHKSALAIDDLHYTAITMTIGSVAMLALALVYEGPPVVTTQVLLLAAWMAVVNTALAFFLWTICLRFMRAFELSMIQNTMLLQVAVMAAIFLAEPISTTMLGGILLVLVGVGVVQLAGVRNSEYPHVSGTGTARQSM
jgi:drug/metabolite transporter (DMT)-like permease